MKKSVALSVLSVGISTFVGSAFAEEAAAPSDHGLELGLRVGYGIPAGKEGAIPGMTNDNLSADVSGIIPIQVDGGYRFNQNVYLGLSFQYAPGLVNNSNSANAFCQTGFDCSASDLRLGLNVNYHFGMGPPFDPWVGLGVGYEWLMLSASGGGISVDATASGFEFANLQLGGDFPVNPNFVVGPFFAVSIGQYRSISISPGGGDQDLNPKSVHEWFLFGVRAAFDIWM
jgi:opacity protein-like surface antigen